MKKNIAKDEVARPNAQNWPTKAPNRLGTASAIQTTPLDGIAIDETSTEHETSIRLTADQLRGAQEIGIGSADLQETGGLKATHYGGIMAHQICRVKQFLMRLIQPRESITPWTLTPPQTLMRPRGQI